MMLLSTATTATVVTTGLKKKLLMMMMMMAPTAIAFSSHSAFTRSASKVSYAKNGDTMLMYDASKDPPDSSANMWSVLATTERWLSNLLGKESADNPYTRKEVSYVCEAHDDDAMVIANIWRRLKESRERGDIHGQTEFERLVELGNDYTPATFRQTQVIVLPNSDRLTKSFHVFDQLVEAINKARRNSRDYVTDLNMQTMDEKMEGDIDMDWSVSVNCAHLHPNFGGKTPEQILQELKAEEMAGEVDVNLQAYKMKRALARQSPYPTIVIETRASPPPDFHDAPPAAPQKQASHQEAGVTSDVVSKLEALFGLSAVHPMHDQMSLEEQEDAFYDAIADELDEISLVTPMVLAQNWVAKHADVVDSASFTESDCHHVDAAYEFVFTNMAMHGQLSHAVQRQYLVMPSFLTASATSLEKFAKEVKNISVLFPRLADVQVLTMHPEHIDRTKRSPDPLLCLHWDS